MTFAFAPRDVKHYYRGSELGLDVSELLNPAALENGLGTAGSYIAEEYVIGGIAAVVLISLLIGYALHILYRKSQSAFGLFIVVMLLPDFLSMPRGDLLGWLSVLAKTFLFVAILGIGWKAFQVVLWLQGAPRSPLQLTPEQLSGS